MSDKPAQHDAPIAPEYLSEEQIELFHKLTHQITKRRLTTPAVLFLESVRPLNFVGSQAMLFFAPMIHAFFTARQYDILQQALERRETIAWFIDLLEVKEVDAAKRERELRAEIKREKRERREAKRQAKRERRDR